MSEIRLRREKLQWVELDGEVVALDETVLRYLSANETAAVLWNELAQGTSRERLADRLVEQFEVERSVAEADVERFVNDLAARGLLAP